MSKDLIEEMYINKNENYFSLERQLFKNAVTESNLKILDIGCGTGILGSYFKKIQNCTVYGVEINENAYKEALLNLDNVIKGNIELIDLPFEKSNFDIIIMGDVLEHLINTISSIKKLQYFLKDDGRILISVPNIRHWKIMLKLLFQDSWKYESSGILDYTHMRFFTKKSLLELFKENDIKVIFSERIIQKKSKSYYFNFFTFNLFSGLLASHTYIELKK
jgi:2-polyprenyl-3-methyl-5-hydroxy-6-metoxy-1,4-benzoquinol methylase